MALTMVHLLSLMCCSLIVGGEAFVFRPGSFSPRISQASRAHLFDGKKLSQLEPMSNLVLVKLHEISEQSNGGIVLLKDENTQWKPLEGTVISCGTGNVRDREGKTITGGTMPKSGDNILFLNSGGVEISDLDGSKHLLIRNEDVMLVFKDSLSLNNIKPAYDRLLIQTQAIKETTAGGIYIPKASNEGDVIEGKVLAVGEGCNQAPHLSSSPISQGESVLFNKHHGVEIEIQGQEYYVLKMNSCLAKF